MFFFKGDPAAEGVVINGLKRRIVGAFVTTYGFPQRVQFYEIHLKWYTRPRISDSVTSTVDNFVWVDDTMWKFTTGFFEVVKRSL